MAGFQEIEQFNILIDEHKIIKESEKKNKLKFKETQTLLISTRKKMEEGLQDGEIREQRFKKELQDTEAPKLKKDADVVIKELENAQFSSTETSISAACK